MKIRALVPFSTGTISMEKYEIKEVSDEVGARLVAAGLVTEISGGGERFIVTLTPTEQDYSGTMDKTVADINAAYEAGQEIWFKVLMGGQDEYTLIPLSNVDKQQEEYPAFTAYVFDAFNNTLIMAWTTYTDDGTRQTYATVIYTLTPAT